ncbi:MAG: alanine racemase [Betaproteobacteria bacterium]|jgi:alanine racemase (EC 5.1.1.1)|nr:alanine racemase [Betaproteobacteria bacterium]
MRPTHIHINLTRLRHNTRLARQCHGGSLLAVVKANAYGHGASACARALVDLVEGFAVSNLDEGIELREAGITQPILLLEGGFGPDELPLIRHRHLTPVIHTPWQAEQLLGGVCPDLDSVWLKMDSGMHRLGFSPESIAHWVRRFQHQHPVPIVVMSHFAHADGRTPHALDPALNVFRKAISGLSVSTSLANSGALLGYPEAQGDWARPGLMLYGLDPSGSQHPPRAPLLPVMSLRSQVFTERWISHGEFVGYGGLFCAQRPTRVGVIPCGYGDGYPRNAPQGTPVRIGQRIVPLIGRVSMDMLTVDLTDAPEVQPGSTVELWGDNPNVGDLAQACGTIAYELICQARRAPHHYQDE